MFWNNFFYEKALEMIFIIKIHWPMIFTLKRALGMIFTVKMHWPMIFTIECISNDYFN